MQAQIDILALQAKANAGDAEAHNALGNAYVNGQGVERDMAQAISHYEKAAGAGFATAAFNLGLLHEVGRGVSQDITQAFAYYLQAAELGLPVAQFNVGNMYARGIGVATDPLQASIWFRRAADAGVADAQFNLAMAYEAGEGVAADPAQAIHWYQQAMAKGFPRAAHNLALMYEEGNGVNRDDAEAARLYLIAAEQNYGPAQNNLGVMHAEGRGGLRQSLSDAYPWFVLAAENGASPRGRDVIIQRLDRIQKADADVKLAALRNRLGIAAPPGEAAAPSSSSGARPAPAAVGRPTTDAELSSQLAELESALTRLKRENAGLVSANQSLSRQKSELEKRSIQSTPANASAQAEIAHINEVARELAQLEAVAPERRRLIEQVIGLLERISRDNLRLNADVKNSTLELSSLNRRLRQAETQAAAARAATRPAADSAELRAAQNEVDQLQRELTQSQARIKGLESGMAAVAAMRRQIETLTTQNDQLTAQVAASAPSTPVADPVEIQARDAEIARLRATAATNATQIQSTTAEVAALTARLAEAQAESEQSTRELAATLSQLSEVENAAATTAGELAASAARVASLQAEATEHESQLAALRAATVVTEDPRVEELAAALATETNLRTELQDEIIAARNEVAGIRQTLSDSTVRVTALQQELANRDAALAEMRAAMALAGSTNESANQARITELTNARDVALLKITAIETQLLRAQQELLANDEIVSQLAAENDLLHARLNGSEQESEIVTEYQRVIAEQADRVFALTGARDTAVQQATELSNRLNLIAQEQESNEHVVSELAAENDTLRAALAMARAEIGTSAEHLTQIRELTAGRDDALAQVARRDQTLSRLESALAESNATIADLAEQLDAVQAELLAARAAPEAEDQSELVAALEAARDRALSDATRIGEQHAATETSLNESLQTIAVLNEELATLRSDLTAVRQSAASHDQSAVIAGLETARDEAIAEADRLRDALQATEASLTANDATITELSNRVDQLQAALAAADRSEEIATLAETRDAALADNARLTEERNTSRAELARTQTHRDQLATQIAALAEDLAAADQSELIESLSAQHDAAVAESGRLVGELAELQATLNQNQTELTRRRSRIAELSDSRDAAMAQVAEFERQLGASRNEFNQSEGRVGDLNQRIVALEAEIAAADRSGEIQALIAMRQTTAAEATRLQEELTAVQAAAAERADTIARLEAQLDKAGNAAAEAAALSGELSTSRDQIAALNSKLDDLRSQLAETTTSRDEALAAVQSAQTAAATDVADLAAQIQQLETALAETESARGEQQDLVAELQGALARALEQTTGMAALRSELSRAQDDRDAAQTTVGQLQTQMQLAASTDEAANAAIAGDLDLARAQITQLDKELTQWRQLAAAAEAEAKSAKSELARVINEYDAEIENFHTVTSVQMQTLQENETAMDALRTALAERESTMTNLRQQLADARTEVVATQRDAQQRVSALTGEVANLEGQIARGEVDGTANRKRLAELEAELTLAQDEVARGQTELAAAETATTALAETRQQLESSRGALADLQAELAAVQQTLTDDDPAAEIAGLEAAREEAQLEIRALNDRLVDSRSKLAARDAQIFELERAVGKSENSAGELVAARKALEVSRNRVASLEDSLAAAQQAAADQSALIPALTEVRDTAQAQVAQQQGELEMLNGQVIARDETIAGLQTELTTARAALVANDQSALVATLRAALATAEAAVESADQSGLIAALESARDAAQAERLALDDQLVEMQQEIGQRDAVIFELERAAEKQAQSATEVAALQQSLREAAAVERLAGVEKQLAELRATLSARDARIDELETARAQHVALVAELSSERDHAITSAEKLIADLNAARALVSDGENQIGQLRSEIDHLQSNLVRAQAAVADADQSEMIAALRTAREAAELDARTQGEAMGELQAGLAARDARILELERDTQAADATAEQLTQAQGELARSQSVQVNLERDLAAVQAQQVQLQAELRSARAAVPANDQTDQIAALELARDTALSNAVQLGEELTAAEHALNANGQIIAELTGRNDQLQTRLSRAREEIAVARSAGASDEVVVALERERDDAKIESNRLMAELSELESTLAENSQVIAELTGENDRLQGDIESSEHALAAALAAQAAAVEQANMNPALNMEVATLHNRVQHLEESIATERSSAAKEFAGLSVQLQRARETNQSLIEANRALLATRVADQASSTDSLAALEQEIADLAVTADGLRADKQALQTALAEAQAAPQAPADWEQTQRALSQRIEELQSEVTSAQAFEGTAAQLEITNAELQTAQADLERRLAQTLSAQQSSDTLTRELRQRVAQLESQLTIARGYESSVNQLSAQTENLLADNLALQTALTEAQSAPRPPADWQNQRAALTNRIESLEAELTGAQALDATVSRLTKANRSLLATQSELEGQLVDAANVRSREGARARGLDQQIAELRKQLADAQRLQTQVDRLSAAQDNLEADKQALETALAQARLAPKPPADWEQQRQALASRVESLARDLETARSYESTASELMAANQALLASQGVLEVRIADSDAAFENATARARALESQLADLNVLPDQLEAVQDELVTLQGSYDAVSRENDTLAQQVAAAQHAASQQQTAAQQAWESERAGLREELDALRTASADMANRSDSDQAQLASLINEVTAARSRITGLENQLTAAGEKDAEMTAINRSLQKAERDLRSQQTSYAQLQNSLTAERRTHESRLGALERENSALNTRLRQAQNTLDQIAAAARVINPAVANVPRANRSPANPTPPTSGADRTHVVVEGDSLTRISMRYYGTPTRWQEIYQANRELLSEANSLQPGQRLRIP